MNTDQTINLAAFAENPDNPQTVTDEAYALLVQSIRDTPQTLEAAKIAYCTDYVALDGTDMTGRCIVIAGNKRLRALKEVYGENAYVPAAWFFDLTPLGEEARRRWLVKSNIQSGEWDAEKLLALYSEDELGALMGDDNLEDLLASIETDTAGGGKTDEDAVPESVAAADTPEKAESDAHEFVLAQAEKSESSAEYEAFVEKFKPRLTTDDCYTPENIYKAVADYVAKHYGRDRALFVRPFYPGGDYEKANYPAGCTIVDNPPFSILSKIIHFYCARKIDFFLFAPALTLFTASNTSVNYVAAGATITYANGANVSTSFVTSLGDNRLEANPELHDTLKEINDANRKEKTVVLKKYDWPNDIITAARLSWFATHHTPLAFKRTECTFVRCLDAQPKGDGIMGGAFLLSERAAAERAAAERAAAERAAAERAAAERAAAERAAVLRYKLSEREREIQKALVAQPDGQPDGVALP